MASLVVWVIFIAVAVLLGLTAQYFSVRTVRWVSAITAVILVCVITKSGTDLWLRAHPGSPPSNLVNAFTAGADALIDTLLRPFLFGYHGSPPGPITRGIAALLLLLGYRELEAWTLHRQAPQLNSTALKQTLDTPVGGASADADSEADGKSPNAQLHDLLAHELRFRLAAIQVRAPAILPGGSRTGGLASIAEASGVTGAGLAGAVIRFAGSIWPSLRQLRLRIWVEPQSRSTGPGATPGAKVTIYLENPRNGATVATKTMVAADINEAASIVAGYVAQQVFIRDPSTPSWCYGRTDGRDLGALLLAGLERAHAETQQTMEASRKAQIGRLWPWACTGRSAGVVRYEMAHLLDLEGNHLAALRLHALNLDQYPRFYRGWYRLGMSLEMIARPGLEFPDGEDTRQHLDEILRVLHRHTLKKKARKRLGREHLTRRDRCTEDDLERSGSDATNCTLSESIRLDLLTAAMEVIHEVLAQLTLKQVVWATFRHRNERAVWLPYWAWLPGWGLRRRWAFHDGVAVAELLVATRIEYLGLDDGWGTSTDDVKLVQALIARREGRRRHCTDAVNIASAIGEPDGPGEPDSLGEPDSKVNARILDHDLPAALRRVVRWSDRLTAWSRRKRSKASWQAAYNAACLYAALAQQMPENQAIEEAVVRCLRSAVDNPRSEIERPSDWISRDPDLYLLCNRREGSPFDVFLREQKRLDYPEDWLSAALPVTLQPVVDKPVTDDALGRHITA